MTKISSLDVLYIWSWSSENLLLKRRRPMTMTKILSRKTCHGPLIFLFHSFWILDGLCPSQEQKRPKEGALGRMSLWSSGVILGGHSQGGLKTLVRPFNPAKRSVFLVTAVLDPSGVPKPNGQKNFRIIPLETTTGKSLEVRFDFGPRPGFSKQMFSSSREGTELDRTYFNQFQFAISGSFLGGSLRGVTEGGGFHAPVRGTMFVRNGVVTPEPSRECDIPFFVKGRPRSAQQSRDSTVHASSPCEIADSA